MRAVGVFLALLLQALLGFAQQCQTCNCDGCLATLDPLAHFAMSSVADSGPSAACLQWPGRTVTTTPVPLTTTLTVSSIISAGTTTTTTTPVTSTSTVIGTVTSTITQTDSVTVSTTSTAHVTTTLSVLTYYQTIGTKSYAKKKRQATSAAPIPSEYSPYCSAASQFLSACECIGVSQTTSTAPRSTVTSTVTVSTTAISGTQVKIATTVLQATTSTTTTTGTITTTSGTTTNLAVVTASNTTYATTTTITTSTSVQTSVPTGYLRVIVNPDETDQYANGSWIGWNSTSPSPMSRYYDAFALGFSHNHSRARQIYFMNETKAEGFYNGGQFDRGLMMLGSETDVEGYSDFNIIVNCINYPELWRTGLDTILARHAHSWYNPTWVDVSDSGVFCNDVGSPSGPLNCTAFDFMYANNSGAFNAEYDPAGTLPSNFVAPWGSRNQLSLCHRRYIKIRNFKDPDCVGISLHWETQLPTTTYTAPSTPAPTASRVDLNPSSYPYPTGYIEVKPAQGSEACWNQSVGQRLWLRPDTRSPDLYNFDSEHNSPPYGDNGAYMDYVVDNPSFAWGQWSLFYYQNAPESAIEYGTPADAAFPMVGLAASPPTYIEEGGEWDIRGQYPSWLGYMTGDPSNFSSEPVWQRQWNLIASWADAHEAGADALNDDPQVGNCELWSDNSIHCHFTSNSSADAAANSVLGGNVGADVDYPLNQFQFCNKSAPWLHGYTDPYQYLNLLPRNCSDPTSTTDYPWACSDYYDIDPTMPMAGVIVSNPSWYLDTGCCNVDLVFTETVPSTVPYLQPYEVAGYYPEQYACYKDPACPGYIAPADRKTPW